MGPRTRWSVAIAVAALGVCATQASAASLNVRSDKAALQAYSQFVGASAASLPAWTQADNGYVSSISAGCPNALAAVGLLSQSAVNKGALTAFGEEAVADLAITVIVADRGTEATLARRLSRLRWSNHRISAAVKHYLAALHADYTQTPSNLCADADALAASNAQTTPAGTSQFLASFATLGHTLSAAESPFRKVLNRFHTRGEARVIKSINVAVAAAAAELNTLLQNEDTKLLTALGISA